MDEIVILIVAVIAIPIIGGILGISAFVRSISQRRSLQGLETMMRDLGTRLSRLEKGTKEGTAPAPREAAATQATPGPRVISAADVAPAQARAAAPTAPPAAPIGLAPAPPVAPPRPPVAPPRPPMEPGPAWSAERTWGDFEKTLGTRWIAYAGVVALFFATAFFIKYAFDNGWIGPTARVVIGIIFGLALLVAGDISVRRKMGILGQALIGGGLAILYLSLFAAYKWYDLIEQQPVFGFMVVVTAAGMVLAVLHNAAAIAVLAILGGFLTPIMLSTGVDARDALFAYILLLDLGVVGAAIFRKWRALEVLALAGTVVLYAGWYDQFYKKEALGPALWWLGAFYTVFLVLPFVYHLRTKEQIVIERFLVALANAAFAITWGYRILYADNREMLGFLALAVAAAYLAMGVVVRKRIPADAIGLFGFVALAVTFLTMAVPLELGLNGILLAWAVEGPVLLYLGYRFKYRPVRIGAFVILGLAFGRLFIENWPSHAALFGLFWNAKFGAAISVPAAAGAFAVVHRWMKKDATGLDAALKIAAACVGGFVATGLVNYEVGQWLDFRATEASEMSQYLPECSSVLVWALGAAGFLAGAQLTKSRAAVLVGLVSLAVSLAGFVGLYDTVEITDYYMFANVRFAASALPVALLFCYGYFTRKTAETMWGGLRKFGAVVYGFGAVALLVLLSVEPYQYAMSTIENAERANWAGQMSLSVVWSVYAAGALAFGFWKRLRVLRFAALGLFAVTALKVLTIDMADLERLYRIISFFGLGLLMIAAAYLYNRVERQIADFFGEKK
jgi:uncharacterized membrane protein